MPWVTHGAANIHSARFRSGKLPKVFKIIPSMANWEELLWLTQPDGWSPAATWMVSFVRAVGRMPRNLEECRVVVLTTIYLPAGHAQATKMFASNLNQKMAQRYYNLVLLPKVRDNIQVLRMLVATFRCCFVRAGSQPHPASLAARLIFHRSTTSSTFITICRSRRPCSNQRCVLRFLCTLLCALAQQ